MDEMILQMALKQKKKVQQAKKGGSTTHSYNSGGVVGINQLAKGDGPKWVPHKKKQQVSDDEEKQVVSSDNEMFILGLLKEQRHRRRTGRGWIRFLRSLLPVPVI